MSSASTRSKTASKKASSNSGLVPPSLLPRPKRACGEKNGQSEQATPADASVITGICKSEVHRRISEVLLNISENTAGVRQSILGLEARISQLETKTSDLEQQLTTAGLSSSIVGKVQTLRRDVNYLLEHKGPREVAPENNRAAGILFELTPSQDGDMESLEHRLEALGSKEAGLNKQKDRAESRRTNKSSSRKQRRAKYATSSSDDTSDSDSDDDSEIERQAKVRAGLRKKVPRYDSLKPLRATDPLYKRLLDYRYYRLERLS